MLQASPLVPSKGALRVLRSLAVVGTLGTTAVFVEDRRRRIRLLRQMQTNAKLIKSGSNYFTPAIQIVRSLADEARLEEAEAALMSALKDPTPPPRALERSYTDLLGRMWKATKDLSETKALFERLEAQFARLPPSVTVFNQMMQSCVEAKDHEGAQYYLQLMTEKYGLTPNVKTVGRMCLLSAQNSDWATVENGFVEMKEKFGHQETYAKDFAAVFNPILIERLKERKPMATGLDFIRMAMDKYGLVPDRYTSNIMVTSCFSMNEMRVLAQWLEIANQFNLPVDSDTAKCLLKRYRRFPPNSRRLLEGLRRIDTKLIDDKCKKVVHDLMISNKWGKTSRSIRLKPCKARLPKITPGEKLLAQMRKQVLFHKNPVDALHLYKRAHEKGIKMPQRVLAAAASALASIKDIKEVESFLAWASGSNADLHLALLPLLAHRFEEIMQSQGFDGIRQLVLGFYRLLKFKHVPILHDLTTKAAHFFLSQHHPGYALRLLREVHESSWARARSFDIECMTLYLEIYTAMKCIEGVRWVVLNVIGLCLDVDRIFHRTLTRACRILMKWISTGYLSAEKQAADIRVLRECLFWIETRKVTQQYTDYLRQTKSVEILELGIRGDVAGLKAMSSNVIMPVYHPSQSLRQPYWPQQLASNRGPILKRSKEEIKSSDYVQIGAFVQHHGGGPNPSVKQFPSEPEDRPTTKTYVSSWVHTKSWLGRNFPTNIIEEKYRPWRPLLKYRAQIAEQLSTGNDIQEPALRSTKKREEIQPPEYIWMGSDLQQQQEDTPPPPIHHKEDEPSHVRQPAAERTYDDDDDEQEQRHQRANPEDHSDGWGYLIWRPLRSKSRPQPIDYVWMSNVVKSQVKPFLKTNNTTPVVSRRVRKGSSRRRRHKEDNDDDDDDGGGEDDGDGDGPRYWNRQEARYYYLLTKVATDRI